MPNRVVFLDRDGVINRRRPDHVKCWSEFEFLPGALRGLRKLREEGERVIVVTNQSAVGRGLVSTEELASIHRHMMEAVGDNGGRIERVYSCIHAPNDGCYCRKPRIGLLRRAARELSTDLRQSVLIGDSLSDVQAAWSAGCRPIFVGDPPGEILDADLLIVSQLNDAITGIIGTTIGAEKAC